jgi:hypothetical protein
MSTGDCPVGRVEDEYDVLHRVAGALQISNNLCEKLLSVVGSDTQSAIGKAIECMLLFHRGRQSPPAKPSKEDDYKEREMSAEETVVKLLLDRYATLEKEGNVSMHVSMVKEIATYAIKTLDFELWENVERVLSKLIQRPMGLVSLALETGNVVMFDRVLSSCTKDENVDLHGCGEEILSVYLNRRPQNAGYVLRVAAGCETPVSMEFVETILASADDIDMVVITKAARRSIRTGRLGILERCIAYMDVDVDRVQHAEQFFSDCLDVACELENDSAIQIIMSECIDYDFSPTVFARAATMGILNGNWKSFFCMADNGLDVTCNSHQALREALSQDNWSVIEKLWPVYVALMASKEDVKSKTE